MMFRHFLPFVSRCVRVYILTGFIKLGTMLQHSLGRNKYFKSVVIFQLEHIVRLETLPKFYLINFLIIVGCSPSVSK
jgi:hypothetical protein